VSGPEEPDALDPADGGDLDELPDKLFFRIGEAAQLVGVEPHVLRYWESEFRLRPQRSASGQRLYRRNDIARFLKIRRLLHDEGFTIAGARKALDEGGSTEPVGSPGPVDSARLQQASERLAAARERVAELRARLRTLGAGSSG
jgi:DNA-binding transcriptional MerR regulator